MTNPEETNKVEETTDTPSETNSTPAETDQPVAAEAEEATEETNEEAAAPEAEATKEEAESAPEEEAGPPPEPSNPLVDKAVKWAEKRGYNDLRANLEGYEMPKGYTLSGDEDAFIPDVTAVRNGSKSYFEVALKTDNLQRQISKWQLMSRLARRNGGKLFLLAPRGHKAFATNTAEKYNLMADVIALA